MEDEVITEEKKINYGFLYAIVYLLDVPYHIDRSYTYYIPTELHDSISIGSFVSVPFGNGNRRIYALVVAIENQSDLKNEKIKPIADVLCCEYNIDTSLIELCYYIRDNTFSTMGEAIRCVVPALIFNKLNEYYTVSEVSITAKQTDELILSIHSFINKLKKTTTQRIKLEFGDDGVKLLPYMVSHGYLTRSFEIREPGGKTTENTVKLSVDAETAKKMALTLKGKKQSELVNAICEKLNNSNDLFVYVSELKNELGDISKQLMVIEEKGIIKTERTIKWRDPYNDIKYEQLPETELSEEQKNSYEYIKDLYMTGEAKAVLLRGVTGSGKTRVIKELCDMVISDGKSVILLIPEIALTPQTVGYFKSCYGVRLAVLHSMLSAGERFDMWRRIKNGDVDICIGTRSAVFAPFYNLGMIVIDEEQEHTYKSDMDPKYHARDIARYRCVKSSALMVLASATPALESQYKAEKKLYSQVEMLNRYGKAQLPDVIVADMRQDTAEGNISAIGTVLKEEIRKNLECGEQTILFLNRRGYNNFLSCVSCGYVVLCPNCSVSLTFHVYNLKRDSGKGYLSCHYCGYRRDVLKICPECESPNIKFIGWGTQRIEDELKNLFPSARISRLDADTTSAKFSYDNILNSFREGESDILLGTQMVTKGHDFPNVTLSAVLAADSVMYLDDYRAGERSFSMICQLIGRSGRAQKNGRAVIQTYNPDHPIINYAKSQDYTSFYNNEIKIRQALIFPPFCDMVLITLTSDDEVNMSKASILLDETIKKTSLNYSGIALQAFGPFEAPIYKINNKFRIRTVLKCRLNQRTKEFLREILNELNRVLYKKINVAIDVNPTNL